jgi:hypothetical protein
MSINIVQELKELIANSKSVKVLATVSAEGVPHTAIKQSAFLNEDGNIEYLELLESSQSYKNFTSSLWYDKKVSFSISGQGDLSFQVIGKPVKILISGPVFEKHYIRVRDKLGDVDLAAVCIVEPKKVINQSFHIKFQQQEELKPVFKHLDRLAK